MTVQGDEAVCLLHAGAEAPCMRRGQCGPPVPLPLVWYKRGGGGSLTTRAVYKLPNGPKENYGAL